MMSVSEILFLVVVLYILYRFVANFLLPVVRATRQVREQFRNMQGNDQGSGSPFTGAGGPFRSNQSAGQADPSGQPGRSAGQSGGAAGQTGPFAGQAGRAPGQTGSTGSTSAAGKRPAAKPPADEYIDFEEIK